MAYGIAHELSKFVPTADFDDIVSDAMCGAMKAARRYDSTTGVPFGAYARHRMRGEAMDGLRRMDFLDRKTRMEVTAVIAETNAAGQIYGDQRTAFPLSLDEPFGDADGEPLTLAETLVDRRKGPEDTYADHEVFRQAFQSLSGPYREVIERKYFRDESLTDIAEEWDLSPSRLSQIHSDAIRRMRVEMLNRGIDTKFLVTALRSQRGKTFSGRIDPLERLRLANAALADLWGA